MSDTTPEHNQQQVGNADGRDKSQEQAAVHSEAGIPTAIQSERASHALAAPGVLDEGPDSAETQIGKKMKEEDSTLSWGRAGAVEASPGGYGDPGELPRDIGTAAGVSALSIGTAPTPNLLGAKMQPDSDRSQGNWNMSQIAATPVSNYDGDREYSAIETVGRRNRS
jgi:hypothetical protein